MEPLETLSLIAIKEDENRLLKSTTLRVDEFTLSNQFVEVNINLNNSISIDSMLNKKTGQMIAMEMKLFQYNGKITDSGYYIFKP